MCHRTGERLVVLRVVGAGEGRRGGGPAGCVAAGPAEGRLIRPGMTGSRLGGQLGILIRSAIKCRSCSVDRSAVLFAGRGNRIGCHGRIHGFNLSATSSAAGQRHSGAAEVFGPMPIRVAPLVAKRLKRDGNRRADKRFTDVEVCRVNHGTCVFTSRSRRLGLVVTDLGVFCRTAVIQALECHCALLLRLIPIVNRMFKIPIMAEGRNDHALLIGIDAVFKMNRCEINHLAGFRAGYGCGFRRDDCRLLMRVAGISRTNKVCCCCLHTVPGPALQTVVVAKRGSEYSTADCAVCILCAGRRITGAGHCTVLDGNAVFHNTVGAAAVGAGPVVGAVVEAVDTVSRRAVVVADRRIHYVGKRDGVGIFCRFFNVEDLAAARAGPIVDITGDLAGRRNRIGLRQVMTELRRGLDQFLTCGVIDLHAGGFRRAAHTQDGTADRAVGISLVAVRNAGCVFSFNFNLCMRERRSGVGFFVGAVCALTPFAARFSTGFVVADNPIAKRAFYNAAHSSRITNADAVCAAAVGACIIVM